MTNSQTYRVQIAAHHGHEAMKFSVEARDLDDAIQFGCDIWFDRTADSDVYADALPIVAELVEH